VAEPGWNHVAGPAGEECLFLVTYFHLKHVWHTPGFVRTTGPIVRQVREAEGLLGYSLRARPLTKEFWTLSAWDDARMLTRFIGRPPHARAMVDLRPRMRAFGSHRWSGPADSVPPSWQETLARLASETTGPARGERGTPASA